MARKMVVIKINGRPLVQTDILLLIVSTGAEVSCGHAPTESLDVSEKEAEKVLEWLKNNGYPEAEIAGERVD